MNIVELLLLKYVTKDCHQSKYFFLLFSCSNNFSFHPVFEASTIKPTTFRSVLSGVFRSTLSPWVVQMYRFVYNINRQNCAVSSSTKRDWSRGLDAIHNTFGVLASSLSNNFISSWVVLLSSSHHNSKYFQLTHLLIQSVVPRSRL